jgi:hypothetical protein
MSNAHGKVISIASTTNRPNKATHTTADTIMVTPDLIDRWQAPPFQRPLHINEKVRTLCEKMKQDDGVFPGVLIIGVFNKEYYLVDGQHRCASFKMSGMREGYADVLYRFYDDLSEMALDYVNNDAKLSVRKPDDHMRALEYSSEAIKLIRNKCPFVGYDMIRRNPNAPILSMSAVIRSWFTSAPEVPANSCPAILELATKHLTVDESKEMCEFLKMAFEAWGRDPEYKRLWATLNLVLCMWLYRRLVVTPYSPRTPKLTKEMFTKCLMSLSAGEQYIDWLLGRKLGEHDRSPCYTRIKTIFAQRLEKEMGKKPSLPQPAWATHSGR